MSPGVQRYRTARAARETRAKFGDHHTASWAAFARAHVAWRGWCGVVGGAPELPAPVVAVNRKGRPIDPAIEIPFGHLANPLRTKLCAAYTTADLRARGAAGFDNRHDRKRKARKLVQSMRTIPASDTWARDQGYRAVMK